MTQHAPSRRAARGWLATLTQHAPSLVPFDPTCSVFLRNSEQFSTINTTSQPFSRTTKASVFLTQHAPLYPSDGSKAKYTGPVDEQGRPDGEGEAKWIKGLRYYKGHFSQGKMDGQCEKYTDPDGNIFKGTMKNDAYLEGKMTMTTGDVFEGSMRNNAPLNGTLTYTDGTVYTYQNGELK